MRDTDTLIRDIRFRAVPFEITNPERIPVKRYYDEEFYKLECERLWPHVWQMACRLEQIRKVGDWIEYSNLGRSVIVVRTRDGVKAYHNACRHRGVQLAVGHGNCEVQGFTCPFHGWRYNMDGKNTFVFGRNMFSEEQLDAADLALTPCRIELWGGCAFINHDDDAPPLRQSIGPLAGRLEAHRVENLRAEWWYATVLPANWKVAMEAFMEGFHVMTTHPQLYAAAGSMYNSIYAAKGRTGGAAPAGIANPNLSSRENVLAQFKHLGLLKEGMGGMVLPKELAIAGEFVGMDLPEDPNRALQTWFGTINDQITERLRAEGAKVPDVNSVLVSDPLAGVEFIFPHYFLLPPFFTGMSSYRVRPLGPESCLFELWSLAIYPEGEEPEPPMEPVMLPYNSKSFPPIPQQDYANIPRQQIGLHAKGFEFMRLGKDVEGLISNYQRLIDGYLKGVAPEKLEKAMTLLGGNFDGAILDLGF